MRTTLRATSRTVVVLVSLWLILILCTGCQHRETHLSLVQADQAITGAGQILAEDVAPVVAQLPPEVQEAFRAAVAKIHALFASAHTSLQPAVQLTAGGEPPPPIPTTVRDAVERTDDFVREAAVQTGRAQAEVDDALAVSAVWSFALKWGEAVAGDLMSQLLLLFGGGGATAVAVAKGVQLWRQAKGLKAAVTDAVAFGNDMAQAETDADVAAVVDRHKERQRLHGTHGMIKLAGAAVRAPPASPPA